MVGEDSLYYACYVAAAGGWGWGKGGEEMHEIRTFEKIDKNGSSL